MSGFPASTGFPCMQALASGVCRPPRSRCDRSWVSRLDGHPGCVSFRLWREPASGQVTLYATHGGGFQGLGLPRARTGALGVDATSCVTSLVAGLPWCRVSVGTSCRRRRCKPRSGPGAPEKRRGWFRIRVRFGVRRAAPVLEPRDCFQLEEGGQKRPPFCCHFGSPKATAVWQWYHFLVSQLPPGRPVLRLNLDETSVRFWYEPRLGLRRPTGRPPRVGHARQATRGQLRRAFSHVAIICDDASEKTLKQDRKKP